MPEAVRQMCRANNGLILVTGKTGSGKSTTLAAMIDDINRRVKGHILTVEDPIEFRARAKELPHQPARDRGAQPEFRSAVHSALREDPDVILIGEFARPRDHEHRGDRRGKWAFSSWERCTPTARRRRRPHGERVSLRQAVARAHHAVDLAAGCRLTAAAAAYRQEKAAWRRSRSS